MKIKLDNEFAFQIMQEKGNINMSVFLITCIEKCIHIVKVWIYDIVVIYILVHYAHIGRIVRKIPKIWIVITKI